jgi:hypothetical protein
MEQDTDAKTKNMIWNTCRNTALSPTAKLMFAMLVTTNSEDLEHVYKDPSFDIRTGLFELACAGIIRLEINNLIFRVRITPDNWIPSTLELNNNRLKF